MSRWRPHTTGILVGGLVLILVALAASYMYSNFKPSTELRLGSGVFKTQLAITEVAREQGLSGVERVAPNGGLLMVYPTEGKWGIWMKDMKIPLDIIWMNNEKEVIYIVTSASPESGMSKTYVPEKPARYVLEVPAGTVKNAGIKIGAKAVFTIVEDK